MMGYQKRCADDMMCVLRPEGTPLDEVHRCPALSRLAGLCVVGGQAGGLAVAVRAVAPRRRVDALEQQSCDRPLAMIGCIQVQNTGVDCRYPVLYRFSFGSLDTGSGPEMSVHAMIPA